MKKRRILVVDDDVTASCMLKLALEQTDGFDVHVENSGARALASCRTFKPELILSDVCMPDMDGGELAGLIRSDPKLASTPIMFLTSIVSKQDTGQETRLSGGYEFIPKPVDIPTLIRHIEQHLPPKPAAQDLEQSSARPLAER